MSKSMATHRINFDNSFDGPSHKSWTYVVTDEAGKYAWGDDCWIGSNLWTLENYHEIDKNQTVYFFVRKGTLSPRRLGFFFDDTIFELYSYVPDDHEYESKDKTSQDCCTSNTVKAVYRLGFDAAITAVTRIIVRKQEELEEPW